MNHGSIRPRSARYTASTQAHIFAQCSLLVSADDFTAGLPFPFINMKVFQVKAPTTPRNWINFGSRISGKVTWVVSSYNDSCPDSGGFQTNFDQFCGFCGYLNLCPIPLPRTEFPWLGDLVEERGGVHERLAEGDFVDLVDGCVWKCCVPHCTQWLMIIIPIKWL